MRFYILADVAELADALDSGSSESNFMWVQLPSSAPCENTPTFVGVFLRGMGDGELKGKRCRADFRWTSATVEDRARSPRENRVPPLRPKKEKTIRGVVFSFFCGEE